MSTPRIQIGSASECELLGATSAGGAARAQVAKMLLKKLSGRCERYCILAGYDDLPDGFHTDIDFMVSATDFERIPRLVDEIGNEVGAKLFQVIPHEISAQALFLAAEAGPKVALLQLDSCSDYRHFGKLWLKAAEVLEARRWHPKGFWIPAARHEFIYYLIKRLNKRDLGSVHCVRLSRLYGEDPAGCSAALLRYWSKRSAAELAEMAAEGNWDSLICSLPRYRSELRRSSTEGLASKIASSFQRAEHTWQRITQPTGGWIAFIGPDGCGKSSIIDAIARELAPAFQRVVRYHLRPKALPARTATDAPVTDPHGRPSRCALVSAMKLLYLFADYWIGYPPKVWAAIVRTKLVLFDRYFYDIVVDPKRVRYGGPQWLLKLLARVVPRPGLVLLLDAPPDVLWSRKQEVSYEEVVRQRQQFTSIARASARAVVIDSAQPLSEVVLQAQSAVIDHFSRRTRRRLGLGALRASSDEATEPARVACALPSIFSGQAAIVAPESINVRIISKSGSPKWILPEDAQCAMPVLKSWRPYGKVSRAKWNVITSACRLNAISMLPGVRSETLLCDLAYWRERMPELSDAWCITGYIGTPSPTQKALLFFIDPKEQVRAVAKVPLTPRAGSAVLNEANILEKVRDLLPAPRILFRDEQQGIAAQTWVGGANVARGFSEEHLRLLTDFASQEAHVRLSDFRSEIMKHLADKGPAVAPALLDEALSSLDQSEQLRSCIVHGDFTPWNLRRLSDGRLTLIDWEWGHEKGFPWQDVCRYFYLQDYLFQESANVWRTLMKEPLLAEYRRFYGLSTEATRGLTIYYLLNFLYEEQGAQDRAEYAVRKIREVLD